MSTLRDFLALALDSDSAIHILVAGAPASAKTMLLLEQLKNSYFADGTY
jgi:hypothetical protein